MFWLKENYSPDLIKRAGNHAFGRSEVSGYLRSHSFIVELGALTSQDAYKIEQAERLL